MQLAALRLGKLLGKLRKLPRQASGFHRHTLDALDKGLGLGKRLGQLLTQTQIGPGIVEQPLAPLCAGLLPGAVEGLNLGARELVVDDGPRHLLTGALVGSGQRDEGFHRRLGRDPASADRLLNGDSKLTHQPQAS